MKYALTKADYEDIKILTAVTESIFDNYQKLIQLETEGKGETSEYQRTIEGLTSSISMEPVIYQRIGNYLPKLKAIGEYITPNIKKQSKESDLEVVIQGDKHKLIERAILTRLSESISFEEAYKASIHNQSKILDEEYEDALMNFLNTMVEKVRKDIEGQDVIQMELIAKFRTDDFLCFLTILQKLIDSPSCQSVRPHLIRVKYELSFCSKRIESELLKNNFVISPQVYLQAPFYGEIKNQDFYFCTMMRKKFSSYLVEEQTEILLSECDDKALSDSTKRAIALLRTGLLRTGLLSLNDEEIMDLNMRFHDTIESDSYMAMHPQNEEVEEMIRNAYRQVKRDKMIPITVSFKEKKY